MPELQTPSFPSLRTVPRRKKAGKFELEPLTTEEEKEGKEVTPEPPEPQPEKPEKAEAAVPAVTPEMYTVSKPSPLEVQEKIQTVSPTKTEAKVFKLDRETADAIDNLEDAIEFAKQIMMEKPRTWAHWNDLKRYIPPYQLTTEQHNILQSRIPITSWNAEAAYWAGVPQEVIQKCIDMGGVNIANTGWTPTDGQLSQFWDTQTTRLTSKDRKGLPSPTLGEQLNTLGVRPSDLALMFQRDLQARVEAGITDENGAPTSSRMPDAGIVEEGGFLFRVSGTRYLDETTGLEDFLPDGRYKVPLIPVVDEDIAKSAITLMQPIEETLIPSKPALPEGYKYGQMENTLVTPTGEIVFARNDDEFRDMLKEIGAIPTRTFEVPTYSLVFPSFSEISEMEQAENMKGVQKALAQMVELEVLDQKDVKDYLNGKQTIADLNEKTQGLFWNREGNVPIPEDLEAIVAEAMADPDDFIELLQSKGRSIEVENLLVWMGASAEDIDNIFPDQPRQPRTVQELITQYEAVNVEELGQQLALLDASGDKETVGQIADEIVAILQPFLQEQKIDLAGWVKSYKDGKVDLQHLSYQIIKTAYMKELDDLFEAEEGKEFRFEKAQPHERKRIIEIMKFLEVPENYIEAIEKGVINPQKFLTAPTMYAHDPVGFEVGFFNDSQYAAYLAEVYLWFRMGDAERKGFWNMNRDNPLSARARYEMWDAPPLVKGALEIFSNPWYLIPIGGTASGVFGFFGKGVGKGAEKLGLKGIQKGAEKFAEKAPEVMTKAESIMAKPITYPISKAGKGAEALLKKAGVIKKFPDLIIPDPKVESVEDFLKYIEEHFPGRIKGNEMTSLVKKANLVHKRGLERGAGAIEIFRNQLNEFGDIGKLVGLDKAAEYVDNSLVFLKPLTGKQADAQYKKLAQIFEKEGRFGWNTVFENYKYFDFANAKAQDWIEASHIILDTVVKYAEEAGVTINKRIFEGLSEYFPRRVIGKKGVPEAAIAGVGKRQARIGGKISAEQRRMIEIFEEGLQKWDYDKPLETLLSVTEGLYRRMAGIEADSIISQLYKPAASETKLGRWAIWFGTDAQRQQSKARRLVDVVRRMKRGEQPAGATLTAIKRDAPELYREIMRAYNLKPIEFDKLIKAIKQTAWRQLRVKPSDFKAKLLEIRGTKMAWSPRNPVTMEQIDATLKAVNAEQRAGRNFLEEFYTTILKMRKDQRNVVLDRLLKDAQDLLAERKIKAYAAKDKRHSILQYLNHIGLTEAYSPETYHVFSDVTINGKHFTGRQIEQQVNKIFSEEVNSWLKGMSEASRGFVTIEASMDMSAPFIQGFFVLGNDLKNLLALKPTAIWPRTFANHVASMFSQNVHHAFMRKYANIYREFEPLGMIVGQGSTEFVETMPKLAKLSGKVPVIGKPLSWLMRNTFGRTTYGFSVWGEEARVLGIASMRDSWLKAGRNPRELTDLWNKLTGVISTRAMGVGASQRAWESATLFAPRFLRSQLLIIGDLFSRGATANMVRKIFGTSLMAWGLAYVGVCQATGNTPFLNPLPEEYGGDGSKFMKVNIGGQWIGLPGFPAMLRLLATVGAHIVGTPGRVMAVDWDNVKTLEEVKRDPLLRDLIILPFRKASPLINLVKEMATGKDFLGRSLDESNDYLLQIAEKFLPIVAQNLVTRDKPATATVWATEVLGFNTYPQSELETFNNMAVPIIEEMEQELDLDDKQLEALETNDFNWYQLDRLQKFKVLQKHPDIEEQLAKVEAEAERWSSKEWKWFRQQSDTISQQQKDSDTVEFQRIRAEDTIYTTKELRWDLSENASSAWDMRKQLENDPRFEIIQTDIDRSKRNKKENGELRLFEQAWDEWWDYVLSDDGVSDMATDEEKFALRQKRIDNFIEEYGETIYQGIRDLMDEKLKEIDTLKYKLAKDKLALTETYWSIVDKYGDPNRKARLEFRQDPDNAEYEALLVFWGYVSKFENPEAEPIVRDWMKEYDIPEKAIPAFSSLIVPEKAEIEYQVTQTEWTEYNEIDNQWERDDQRTYNKWQYLLTHPNLNAYMVKEEGRTDARTVFHNIPESDAWLEVYKQYEALTTSEGKPDRSARYRFREQNPDFDELGVLYGYWKRHPTHAIKDVGKPVT